MVVYDNGAILAHADSAFITFDKDNLMVFEDRNPKEVGSARETEFQNFHPYLEETVGKTDVFLRSYVKHFRGFIPDSEERACLLRNALSQQKAEGRQGRKRVCGPPEPHLLRAKKREDRNRILPV